MPSADNLIISVLPLYIVRSMLQRHAQITGDQVLGRGLVSLKSVPAAMPHCSISPSTPSRFPA